MRWGVLSGPPFEAGPFASAPLFAGGYQPALAKQPPSPCQSDLETWPSPNSPALGDRVAEGSLTEFFSSTEYRSESELPMPPEPRQASSSSPEIFVGTDALADPASSHPTLGGTKAADTLTFCP